MFVNVCIYRQYVMEKKKDSVGQFLIKKDDGNKTNECVTAIKWWLIKGINVCAKNKQMKLMCHDPPIPLSNVVHNYALNKK